MLNKIPMCQSINTCVLYKHKKTNTNDPTITQAMRYSQIVNNYSYTKHNNIIYPYKTPLFTNYHSK